MDDIEVLARLTQGTLHSLQRLEGLSNHASDEKESIGKQHQQLTSLQKSLQQLMQQRDRLTYTIQHGPAKVLSVLLMNENADIEVTSEAEHATVISLVAFAKRLKTLEFLQAYRLSGVTFANVSDRRIRIRWDTFYHGQYYEPYYMELEFKSHQMRVYRHTLPVFLPLTALTEEYLNQDLACFVDEISDLLNAYICRREQVAELKQHHAYTSFPVREVSTSQSMDYIQFSILPKKQRDTEIQIDLFYDDLYTTLPTRVCLTDVSENAGSSEKTDTDMKLLESSLNRHKLAQALSSVI